MKKPKKSDIKIFVIIWSFIFVALAFYPMLNGESIQYWSLLIAFIFALIAVFNPFILLPFYKIWIRLGEMIGGIVSKIIMIIIFYCLFTPISFVLKIFKVDLLNKQMNKNGSTYWLKREKQPNSLKNQF